MIATGSLEPGDGQRFDGEPMIGWRAWVIADNELRSIAADFSWQPGENVASCIRGCADVPGRSCQCGFWALNSPLDAMRKALTAEGADGNRTVAVGLIHGYGAIALHGSEGFRAQYASVACIFADAPEPFQVDASQGRSGNHNPRKAVAERFGVPCPELDSAVSIGLLHELGVKQGAIDQIRAWLAGGWRLSKPVPHDAMAALRPLIVPGHRLARAFLGGDDTGAAEDVVQAAAFTAWRQRIDLIPKAKRLPWFLAIVANACRQARIKDTPQMGGASLPARERAEQTNLVMALNKMTPDDRLLLLLHYYLDLMIEDVALATGFSEDEARARLAELTRRLRRPSV